MASRNSDENSRAASERPAAWRLPGSIPTPAPQPGWRFKWGRKSARGETDQTNMHRLLESGWVPCTIEDCPELGHMVQTQSSGLGVQSTLSGYIEYGGLILMKLPAEGGAMRDKHFADLAKAQTDNVHQQLMQENDPRMPLFKEHKSKVSFGRG